MPLVGELVLWNITWSPHFRQLLPVSSNKFRSELQGMKIRCPSLEAVSRQSQHLAVKLPNCLTVLKPSMTFQGHLYQPAVALQSPSRVQLFVTPWTVACQAFPLSPKVSSNSCPLSWWCPSVILCHPLLLLPSCFSQHQGLFHWVSSLHQVAKVLEFELQLQHQSFQWTFRVDLL